MESPLQDSSQCSRHAHCLPDGERKETHYTLEGAHEVWAVERCRCEGEGEAAGCRRVPRRVTFFPDGPFQVTKDLGQCVGHCPGKGKTSHCQAERNTTIHLDGPNGSVGAEVVVSCACESSCYRSPHFHVLYDYANSTSGEPLVRVRRGVVPAVVPVAGGAVRAAHVPELRRGGPVAEEQAGPGESSPITNAMTQEDRSQIQNEDEKPITGLCIVEDVSKCPESYHVISKTVDGATADLWKDGYFQKKVKRFLCVSKIPNAYLVESIKVIGDGENPPGGYTNISATKDTGQKAIRKKTLCVRQLPQQNATQMITDVILLSRDNSKPPDGYYTAGLHGSSPLYPHLNGSQGSSSPNPASPTLLNGGYFPARPAPQPPPLANRVNRPATGTLGVLTGLEGVPFVFGSKLQTRSNISTVNLPRLKSWNRETALAEVMDKATRPGYIYAVDCDVVNHGIPYGDNFYVFVHFCMTRVSASECRIILYGQVKYRKSTWGLIKNFIEKNTYSGMEEYYGKLASELLRVTGEQIGGNKRVRGRRTSMRKTYESGVIESSDSPLTQVPPHPRLSLGKIVPMIPQSQEGLLSGLSILSSSGLLKLIAILLIGLLISNVYLFYQLRSLEDQASLFQRPVITFQRMPASDAEWVEALKQQEKLHQAEVSQWKDIISMATALLKKAETSMELLQQQLRDRPLHTNTPER
ncbi:unnamed protein product [Darwinula stevensoni]|uniref:VASt domain-containing protein n=1 Tax=Darwinula stevensoni TaxID=69355 RepID=A0A7R9FR08_9CRUS|nr:unnamed protein product [Darwinula stevensoni]CAG0900507.1 unnamed protein product [Darwinula stevensoni]